MTPCRSTLGSLRCQRDGGHDGPHRNRLTVWGDRMPEWIRRAADSPNGLSKDLTPRGAA